MKVRLKLPCSECLQIVIFCFNSMKVRLKLALVASMISFASFQFHEGPIKTNLRTKVYDIVKCFNSMKVRLKHVAKATSMV